MFLIRTAFWLSIVILFLPTGGSGAEQATQPHAENDLSAFDAFGVARETVADLGSFCSRNPATCETGSAALKLFGQKAQYGVRMVYEYVSELDLGTAAIGSRHANDTLRPGDLEEPWRGPELRG